MLTSELDGARTELGVDRDTSRRGCVRKEAVRKEKMKRDRTGREEKF